MDGIKLTSSEWNILICLWEHSPKTVMQISNEPACVRPFGPMENVPWGSAPC